MSKFIMLAISLAFCLQSLALEGSPKSFRDWKNEKLSQFQRKVLDAKATLDSVNMNKSKDIRAISQAESEHLQAVSSLEVAMDLTVTDYVALYLASHPSKNRFIEVAGQLKPAEIAEVLQAFSDSLGSTALSAPMKSNPTAFVQTK